MLKILVGHAYYLKYDRKQWERGKPYPPLATIQVAALLRRLGHEVALFDAMLAEGVEDFAASLHGARPDVVVLYEDNFNFLTKMCLGRMREAACRMIAEARAAGARVIVAGSDASDHPEAFLAAGAEAVLIGEGVATLAELIGRLERAPDVTTPAWVAGLAGVAAQVGGQQQLTRVGALPPDPRLVGHPAWDLIDIERYRAIWHERHGFFSLNMAASRGCPFRCNWCAKPIWGNHYMQRSPQDVAAEMSHLKHAFRPDHIWMADDIFGFRVDWVTEFGEHLRASDGAVPFTIQTRADLISERMAEALAQAGCAEAWIGAESGSQRVLDAMNKGTRVTELIVARERLGRHGIRVGFFIQLGYLGEELADLLATRELVAQAAPDDIGVSVSYPLPGTRFYELVKARLGRKTHWRDSGDLAMMFRGAYDSEFYRSVRDLLHEQVVLQQTKAGTPPKRYRVASAALAARWDALVACEHAHRNHDATPPPVPRGIALQVR
ncbi:Mg-protoporphyrin IX monomethyl ester oxidative cyclase [Rhodanobacter sp. C06]|uniref:B12-binding domain-containing radical SAM protein n=1 Tax=Rhodanobacter sp. C06 TaxID=1945854 RepID=UPI000985FAE3|nr:radical SAM protein [Rhodanobacter sp. C06]OOG38322.1 Mg-protoporphyrin IX monomethyl ester oxidative cyclase [Rhodanobacter sp. C06]